MTGSNTALLVLEDGRIFRGESFGAVGESLGEAVFTTGMTGYQETLTDPSYHRQIVLQTAPQIGNTGWNAEDDESARIQVAGYVVRDPSRRASNWRSTGSLSDALRDQGVVGVAGIDTRAAVRHLRERGAMRAGVFSGPALASDETLVERVRQSPQMEGADLYGAVTTAEPYVVPAVGERRFVVAALDVGIKSNTPRMLAARGVEVHVLPADTAIEAIDELRPDGFFLANGPGDPATADGPVALTRQVLERRIPLFGICFGNQIFGRALGRGTYKLRYGHRGINIPVIEHATGRVAITSQNHGFAVQGEAGETFRTPFGTAQITHTCPNDGCVEGMAGTDFPAFSVQYHPEAAAGPHDAADLFDRFVTLMAEHPVGYAGAAGLPLPGVDQPLREADRTAPDHTPAVTNDGSPLPGPADPDAEAPTGPFPVVAPPGAEPDPLTAPFSDVEDSLVRRPGDDDVATDPSAVDPSAVASDDGGPGRSGPVTDRPWPPPRPGDEHADPTTQPRQEDR
ncbi:glutamine-hydrolyzing carbamoyl-phosphate synthase small subunit [Pseudonocardia sp. KRD-291]|nr:glutamine-hydrolyzing carbamoyl-phosphate synthase small subunit [Pseudonocardia sp. KRD291]